MDPLGACHSTPVLYNMQQRCLSDYLRLPFIVANINISYYTGTRCICEGSVV